MKGLSPLVASVLLIAITMAIAAVLASYVTNLTRSTLSTTTCIGGDLNFISADYPKWDNTNKKIIAALESRGVPLGDFKFEVRFANDIIQTYSDTQGLKLSAGASGTAISSTVAAQSPSEIRDVRVTTNCTNVATARSSLR